MPSHLRRQTMLEATLLAIRPPVHPVFVEIFTGISVTDYITPVSGVGSHPDRLAVETQPTEGQTMLKTLSAAVGVLFVDKSCKPSIFFMLFSFLCFNQIRDMGSNKAFPFEIAAEKDHGRYVAQSGAPCPGKGRSLASFLRRRHCSRPIYTEYANRRIRFLLKYLSELPQWPAVNARHPG